MGQTSHEEFPDPQVEHAALDHLTKRLNGGLAAKNRVELMATIRQFERVLRAHFASEELRLLVDYHAMDAADCEVVESQHDRLRADTRACRESLQAGEIDAERIRKLLVDFRMHQAHEDSLLYKRIKWRTGPAEE